MADTQQQPPYTLEQAEEDISSALGQLTVIEEAHTFIDATDPPDNPASGSVEYSLAGHQKYASSDGGDYNTGRATAVLTNDQTVNSATQTALSGVSLPVDPGVYRIRAVIGLTQSTAGGSASIGITAPTASSVGVAFRALGGSVSTAAFNTSVAGVGGSLTMAAATQYVMEIDGTITFSASGNVVVTAATSPGADTWRATHGSFLELFPVT